MTVLGLLAVLMVFGGSGERLALLFYKIMDKKVTVTVLAATATPLKLNPPFPSS